MKDPLVGEMVRFLSCHLRREDVVLVGFSGGGDSTALLHLLLACRPFFPLTVHVLHFDHAWRSESRHEADLLQEKISSLGLPFHRGRSQGGSSFDELKARQERYAFFLKIYREVGAQSLFLGHQQEDQAETVLKRFLEGAGLTSLGGMEKRSSYEGMVQLRPLLHLPKDVLLEWNRKRGFAFLEDSTNQDTAFLRARMRKVMLPDLEKAFGKGVQRNLCLLGQEFHQLKEILHSHLSPHLQKVKKGSCGFFLPLSSLSCHTPLERQELIRMCLKEQGVVGKRERLVLAEQLARKNEGEKLVLTDPGVLFVSKGDILYCSLSLQGWNRTIPLQEARRLELYQERFEEEVGDPLSYFLEGQLCYFFPETEGCDLTPYPLLNREEQKKLSFLLSKNRIPARMRGLFLFPTKEGMLLEDCLPFNPDVASRKKKHLLLVNLKLIF